MFKSLPGKKEKLKNRETRNLKVAHVMLQNILEKNFLSFNVERNGAKLFDESVKMS